MKFAIIGKGFIYPRHKQAIEGLGHEVVMTCDIDTTKDADYTDWVKMFHSPEFKDIDAVSICTPNYLHSVIAREASLLGKKVLCEKPLTPFQDYSGLEEVSTVLQLRNNTRVKELKATLGNDNQVSMVANVFRDEQFWNGWKGNEIKAGSPVLHIIGVHYLDLLIHLLGEPLEVFITDYTNRKATGGIKFEKGFGTYHFEISPTRENQTRYLTVNGEKVKLSDQDNISYEDLHKEVYKDFIDGKGTRLSDARRSLDLREKLKYGA